MKLLYIVEDRFPPFRADVVELFGKQMAERGHKIDWLMQSGPDTIDKKSKIEWLGNTVYLTPRRQGEKLIDRIINNFLDMLGDLMIIPLAVLGQYDIIQVRDKFFASLIAWLAARLTGARFVYWMSYPFAESKLYQARNRLIPYRHLVWLKGRLAAGHADMPGLERAHLADDILQNASFAALEGVAGVAPGGAPRTTGQAHEHRGPADRIGLTLD